MCIYIDTHIYIYIYIYAYIFIHIYTYITANDDSVERPQTSQWYVAATSYSKL